MKSKILISLLIILLIFLSPIFAEDSDTEKTKQNKDPFSQQKYLPEISFILDLSYVRRNLENHVFESLEMPGFLSSSGHSHEGDHGHSLPNSSNGFNLNYGELVLFASVDPYFDLFTSFHLGEGSFEIEEAYVTSRRLPMGLGLKVGKFLSAFGRQNAQHGHIWDFTDLPLVLRAFFGDEGVGEIGMQLNWLAPTDFYLSFGVETLQGDNENSFGTEGFDLLDAEMESELIIQDTPLPNLWTFYTKTSMELGNLVVLAGVSYALGQTRSNHLQDEEEAHAFSGETHILGVDVFGKYIIDSYRYLSFQFEYLSRRMTGSYYSPFNPEGEHEGEEANEEHNHEFIEVETSPSEKTQAGFYSQFIFRFHRAWRIGMRWDSLHKNDVFLAGDRLKLPGNLNRYSFMIDHNPTEFSRVRFQYNINRYAFLDGVRKDSNEFVLQLNLAIGAHGSHPF
jgi:hypothetical protein